MTTFSRTIETINAGVDSTTVDERSLQRKRASRRASKILRRGVASVEMAIILPILLTLVLGSMEVCQRLFLRQSAVVAAYESIRMAARSTSTAAGVELRCQEILTDRRVTGAIVTLTPANFSQTTIGDTVKINIRIPWSANSTTRFVLKDQGFIEINAAMLRE